MQRLGALSPKKKKKIFFFVDLKQLPGVQRKVLNNPNENIPKI